MISSKIQPFLILAIVTVSSICVFSQQRSANSFTADKYLVSARAGGVNYVDGLVGVTRPDGKSGLVLRGDQLEIGDRVVTDSNSRVELLLNPGSYLRLGSNSAFEFKTTSLDDLQLKFDSGSAMFEVFAADDFTVSIFTPKGKAVLVESGVYRVDVSGDGNAVIAVTEGKALVGSAATVVKKGRTGTIDSGSVVVAKFDRGKRDDLAEWSKTRAKGLAKLTDSLKNREVRNSLANSFLGRRWSMRDSFGLWVLDPFTRSYCFLPFGYGWYSPYGYGYNNGIYWYNLPQVIRVPIRQPPIDPGEPTKTRRTAARDQSEPPPYRSIEKVREPFRSVHGSDFPDAYSPMKSSEPSRSAPVYIPAPEPIVRSGKKPD